MTNAEATAASGLQVVDVTDCFVQSETLRILHVDDDPSLLSVSKIILESENKFEVDNVTSVDEAFSKLETSAYDAVISDYEMPVKNGLDFLKELREQKNNIAFLQEEVEKLLLRH